MAPGMDPTRKNLPSWAWIAAAAVIVAVPIVISVAIPASPTGAGAGTGTGTVKRGWSDSVNATPLRVPPPANAQDPPLSDAPSADATTSLPVDVTLPQLEMEMASLRTEKEAIEGESVKLAKKRGELENFEKDHPDGVAPELYSRYEDARNAYNADVIAFKSRTSLYQMKVADLERRVDSLRIASGAPATP